MVVSFEYPILASAGVPASKLFPSNIPKNVSLAAGGPVKAIVLRELPKVNALLGY